MLTRPGCTLPVTPETFVLPCEGFTDEVLDEPLAGVFCAAGVESFENSDPPRLAFPSSAPPTSTIAMTAKMARPRRQCGCEGTGASGGSGVKGGGGDVGELAEGGRAGAPG